MVSYRSTRGQAPDLSFADALLTGLATDGGLYCPDEVPALPPLDSAGSYAEVAREVMWPYVEGSVPADDFTEMVDASYATFRHPDVCPVDELGDGHYLLDLTKGPTLAFKDVALQLVGRLLDAELGRRQQRVTVLGATSGDTGSAAIEALQGRANVDVVILHPYGRVSEVQRRQMTTVDADNITNLAVDGTFDDCQNLVKAAFADPELRARHRLAAVNSINWARVMAQIVYYVTSARSVNASLGRAIDAPVSFCVPTGNFGNVLAGWYAKRMGLPIDQLVVASNRNDVLTRFFETGRLWTKTVEPSLSPSMDIQISSNFERLLWEVSDRDSAALIEVLEEFRSTGSADVPESWVEAIRAEFDGARLDDNETLAEIARMHDRTGRLIDPHTAIGTEVARRERRNADVPMITLATADPAKFGDAVEKATGIRPELPPHLAELFDRPERVTRVANDLGAVAALLG